MKSNLHNVLDHIDDEMRRKNELAAFIVEGKAKRRCPVDSGRLRASITHETDGTDGFIVGTNVEYAPFVELGTRYMSAQPFLVPALQEAITELREIYNS
jgi:HK97 gp10 family phage protein